MLKSIFSSSSMADSFDFNVELEQNLNLIFNPKYSKREIFLRELIFNASDALEKNKWQHGWGQV